MTTNKLDLNANFNPKMDMTRIPQCHNSWCTSNLPANHSVPLPHSPPLPNAIFVRVCDNCYYDYKFEGIETYSCTDDDIAEMLGQRKKSLAKGE